MVINGVLMTLVAAAVGGVLFEGLKLLDRWVKSDKTLGAKEVVWSAAMVAVGSLVPLVYGVKERNFIEVAQLGVAIPALVTGGFKVASKPVDETAATARKAPAKTRGRARGGAVGTHVSSVPKPTARSSAFVRYAGWRF